jgi:Pyruvate/2-oxoglutarate dehydrogenase complex, dihydrolipoamide dehydrogenase (E3) component, and related enzymes
LKDPSVNAVAIELLKQEFPVHLGQKADLHASKGGMQVRAGSKEAIVDSVLVSLGRRPNIDNLGLEALGIELDEHGLPPVDPHTMQIADLPVFMAGDINDRIPLLHEAADEGHIAGINATRRDPMYFKRRVPLAIVFTDPNIAMIGRRFNSLDGNKILTGEVCFKRQGRARVGQRNKGILRLYAEPESGRLVGAEICAPAGEHMAHLVALAIERSLTVHDMLRLPFYHPTLEEGLRSALRQLSAQVPACGKSDLAGCDAFDCEALN